MNVLIRGRYLVAAVQKKLLCPYGCRGWCTFFPLFEMLRWSCSAIAEGMHPSGRHDGKGWLPSDVRRQSMSGRPVYAHCAVPFIKGDWSEYGSTLGFPTWADGLRPCFLCNVNLEGLDANEETTLTTATSRENQAGEYSAACDRCEHKLLLTARTRDEFLRAGKLFYDKRQGGSRGRALYMPVLGLQPLDRIGPSSSMSVVGDLDTLSVFPVEVTFWRPANETLARHRCPLFDPSLGLEPCVCLTVDLLHALHLGVMNTFCRDGLWLLILDGTWGKCATQEETVDLPTHCIAHEIDAWYKRRHATHPLDHLTRFHLSRKKLGDISHRACRSKDAETNGLCIWLVEALFRHRRLGKEVTKMAEAGRNLLDMVDILNAHGWSHPQAAVADAFRHYQRFLVLTVGHAGARPKRHLLLVVWHMRALLLQERPARIPLYFLIRKHTHRHTLQDKPEHATRTSTHVETLDMNASSHQPAP